MQSFSSSRAPSRGARAVSAAHGGESGDSHQLGEAQQDHIPKDARDAAKQGLPQGPGPRRGAGGCTDRRSHRKRQSSPPSPNPKQEEAGSSKPEDEAQGGEEGDGEEEEEEEEFGRWDPDKEEPAASGDDAAYR
eukprot:scaffold29014_cov118-Isochrysis_galbana.AAC.4